jgi:hypothetical protein
MQRRLVITGHEPDLESDVVDREVRLQQIYHGTPHRFCILPATNRNVRCQAGIVARDRPHMPVVIRVHGYNLSRCGTDGLRSKPRGIPCRRIGYLSLERVRDEVLMCR